MGVRRSVVSYAFAAIVGENGVAATHMLAMCGELYVCECDPKNRF